MAGRRDEAGGHAVNQRNVILSSRRLRAHALLALILAIAGCGRDEPITHGVVINKWIEEAHTRIVPKTYLDADGDRHTRFVTDHIPRQPFIQIELDGQKRNLPVDDDLFNEYRCGDRFQMEPAERAITIPL